MGKLSSRIDWPAFLSRHDMRFKTLPSCWQEAPHFGNATLGSMLYKVDNTISLQVFRIDVHDHRDETYGWTAYSRPRFLIGHFALEAAGALKGCRWRQDFWNAELRGVIWTERGEIGIRHFVHADDMAIVTEVTPSEGEAGCKWSWHPHEAWTSRPGYPANEDELAAFAKRYGSRYLETLKPFTPNPQGRLEESCGILVWIQDFLAGGQYAVAWAEERRGAVRTHIATIANSYPSPEAAAAAAADVERFRRKDRDSWNAAHREWWHSYYPRSYVAIPDSELESLYWQTVYRYGCNARTGRSFVDTSGIWFQGGPWAYTTNDWNTQSAHWAVYAANRLEQGDEIVNQLYRNRERLAKAVLPEEWQADSAYLHLATTGDMAADRRSDMRYYDLVGCLPWLLNNAWSQYRFSMDDEMLRVKIFPLLRRAVNLYFHLAEEGGDGRIHLKPTYSPETGVWRDANFDLSLFKWGCHVLVKAAKRLGIEDPLMPKWQDVIERLVDFPADENGFRLGAEETSREKHRHFSNLLMIYPLYLVNVDQPASAEVLQQSAARAHATRGLDAMVQTHAGPISASLGQGDTVLEGLKRQVLELHPNGLWSCAGNPCIEASLSVMNSIQTMLIQSWSDPASDEPGPIRIFPALPSTWKDVEFRDLRAEGAFLVSAKRSGGVTEWVRVRSLAGEPCRLKVDFKVARVDGTREYGLSEAVPGVVQIDLKRGEEVILTGKCKKNA